MCVCIEPGGNGFPVTFHCLRKFILLFVMIQYYLWWFNIYICSNETMGSGRWTFCNYALFRIFQNFNSNSETIQIELSDIIIQRGTKHKMTIISFNRQRAGPWFFKPGICFGQRKIDKPSHLKKSPLQLLKHSLQISCRSTLYHSRSNKRSKSCVTFIYHPAVQSFIIHLFNFEIMSIATHLKSYKCTQKQFYEDNNFA